MEDRTKPNPNYLATKYEAYFILTARQWKYFRRENYKRAVLRRQHKRLDQVFGK